MKKVVTATLFLFIVLGMMINPIMVLAQEDDSTVSADASITADSDSDSDDDDNSGSSDDSDSETRTRTETRTQNADGTETRTRTETRIRVRDGEIERELRVRAEGVNAERIRNAIETKNRLRIRTNANAEIDLPEGCSRTGVVTRCRLEDGTREITVTTGSGNVIVVTVGGANMTTNATLYHHDGKVFAVFENQGDGESEAREIKILPDEVRAKVRERIKAQIESEGEIELEESGRYRMEVRKRARLLGLFSVSETVNVEVDPETGEILRERTPWWSFLSTDIDAESETDVEAEQ